MTLISVNVESIFLAAAHDNGELISKELFADKFWAATQSMRQ
jgi:hypothetical protein